MMRPNADAGRAHSLAVTALQAQLHVANEAVVDLDPALVGGADQVQPAAGRFGLETGGHKRRAVHQTQPAVDAT